MSGIEATGLVLGALPLIIEAIKAYANGAATVWRYAKYKRRLIDLSEELAVEMALFENVCDELLDGLIEDYKWKAILLQDPGGEAWKERVLEDKLKSRLRGSLYQVYVKAMKDMRQAVAEIQDLLKLGEDNRVRLSKSQKVTGFAECFQVQINASDRFDKEKKRWKFSIKPKHYENSVAQIRRSTKRLKEATQFGSKMEARVGESRRLRYASRMTDLDFSTIQHGAARVYNIIRCQLRCSCRSFHVISLPLEPWKNLAARTSQRAVQPSFRVLFSYGAKGPSSNAQPWNMEAVEIFPDEDEPDTLPSLQQNTSKILTSTSKAKVRFQDATVMKGTDASRADLASNLLSSISRSPANICLQQLLQGTRAALLTEELLNPPSGVPQSTNSVHSLSSPNLLPLREALLSDSTVKYRRRFSNLVKLRLSVSLAWSLLQLHRTPWFSETWTNSDINLLDLPHYSLLDQSFISRKFPGDNEAQQDQLSRQPTSARPRNGALFALGVLLIELCLGAPFDKLREPQQLEVLGLPDTCSDYEAADCLIDDVYDRFGDNYGDAVLKCIRCEFGCRRNSLDDERFRRAFYDGVVVLLEKNLEVFHAHRELQRGGSAQVKMQQSWMEECIEECNS